MIKNIYLLPIGIFFAINSIVCHAQELLLSNGTPRSVVINLNTNAGPLPTNQYPRTPDTNSTNVAKVDTNASAQHATIPAQARFLRMNQAMGGGNLTGSLVPVHN